MNVRRTAVAVGTAVVAGAVGVTVTSATAQPAARHPQVSAAPARPATAGGVGWQGPFVYNVPTGLGSLFFHYSCPAGLVARNGGFNTSDQSGTIRLTGNGPRWDLGANNYTEWFWVFKWPSGSPAGESIQFDVYCTNRPV